MEASNKSTYLVDAFNVAVRETNSFEGKRHLCLKSSGTFIVGLGWGPGVRRLTETDLSAVFEAFKDAGARVDADAVIALRNRMSASQKNVRRRRDDSAGSTQLEELLKNIKHLAPNQSVQYEKEQMKADKLPTDDSQERLKRAKASLDGRGSESPSVPSSRRTSVALIGQMKTLGKIAEAALLEIRALKFTSPFIETQDPQRICEKPDRVPDTHPAIRDAKAEAFVVSDETPSGDSIGFLRCKGYLKENEFCADYIMTHHYSTHSISVVVDSAGNDEDCFLNAKALTNHLLEDLHQLIKDFGEDAEQMGERLASLIAHQHLRAYNRLKSTVLKGSHATAAFACRINRHDGKQLILGGTIGDARILYVSENGHRVENMSYSRFDTPYRDAAGSLGGNLPEKLDKGERPIQLFARIMKAGDRVILGSDGMGDNLEPKTMGRGPKDAYLWLAERGRAPEIDVLPDELPTDPALWHAKEPENADSLQAIHNAFIECRAEEIISGSENPVRSLFEHCTQSPAVNWGVRRAGLEDLSKVYRAMSQGVTDLAERLIGVAADRKNSP